MHVNRFDSPKTQNAQKDQLFGLAFSLLDYSEFSLISYTVRTQVRKTVN
jgi:hypothetical protein